MSNMPNPRIALFATLHFAYCLVFSLVCLTVTGWDAKIFWGAFKLSFISVFVLAFLFPPISEKGESEFFCYVGRASLRFWAIALSIFFALVMGFVLVRVLCTHVAEFWWRELFDFSLCSLCLIPALARENDRFRAKKALIASRSLSAESPN